MLSRALAYLLSTITRRRLTVLTYHNVFPMSRRLGRDEINVVQFIEQMEWLKDFAEVVPLSVGLENLNSGANRKHQVAITFDDGYENVVTTVLPALNQLNIKASFFVVPGLFGKTIWTEDVRDAIRRFQGNDIDLIDLGLRHFDVRESLARHAAADAIVEWLKSLPDEQRREMVAEICLRSGVVGQGERLMNAEQVHELAETGMEVGSHSAYHPILSQMGADRARQEIFQSKRLIEEVVGKPVRYFAYPNGRPGVDFTQREAEFVRDAGYSAAFATGGGSIAIGSDAYQLPRFTPWDKDRFHFQNRIVMNIAGWTRSTDVRFVQRSEQRRSNPGGNK